MALHLHNQCKERLVEVLTEQLSKIKVANKRYLDRKSMIFVFLAEESLPDKGKIKEQLDNFLSETPLYDFIYETLSSELQQKFNYDPELPEAHLISLEGYRRPRRLALRLVEEFDKLPWNYMLTIKLGDEISSSLGSLVGDCQLTKNLWLVRPTKEWDKKYPLKSSKGSGLMSIASLLSSSAKAEWEKDKLYFQLEVDGFVGYWESTETITNASALLKTFCGLGIALRLFKVDYKYKTAPIKASFQVHKKVNDRWAEQKAQEIETSVADTLDDLRFNDLDGELNTDLKKRGWVNRNLKLINIVLSNPIKAEKIILASQWLFDSFSGKNELLSFVQTTVAMEILLGDKAVSDLLGLGELLRNRCAYLIGSTQKQRDRILREFKEIYDIRSKIVHRGKSKLTYKERSLFRQLQWMCRRVIQEEVELLEKDNEEKN